MKINGFELDFKLNNASIDAFSEVLAEKLEELQLERRNILRIRLSLEEALIRMRDRFGEDKEVNATITTRFNRPAILIELEGSPFNPLSKTESEVEAWSSSLLTSVGMNPQYSYNGRSNILRLSLPVKRMNPALKIVISIALGVLLGLAGTTIMSPALREDIIFMFLAPIFNVWLRILNVLSGPVVFFMVITTIVNTSKISQRGASTRTVYTRYFAVNFLCAIFAVLGSGLIYRLQQVQDQMDTAIASSLLDQILKIVPDDIISPFIESNTPQLMLIAAVIGNALIVAGSQVRELTVLISQINLIGMLMAEWISRLVPFFITLLIAFEIWQKTTALLKVVWLIIVVSLILSVLALLVVLLYTGTKEEVSPKLLGKKLWEPFRLTIREGSQDAAYGLTEQTCVQGLGIDREFTAVSMTHGLVLYMPVSVIGILVFTVFAAYQYGMSASTLWYVKAIIIAVLMFEATPPVPGANLLAYTVIFSALGIPEEALIDAMIFDIVFGLFAAAANQMMLQLELVLQADHLGLLDKTLLKQEQ